MTICMINPQDIIVSHEPLNSSARNSFSGKIIHVFDEDPRITLIVNVGEALKVKMTKDSLREMGLRLGDTVYLTFKSTAVEIF